MQMNDLISRAAAIAEIEEYIEEYSELEPETGYHNLKWCAMEEAKDVLSMLPAVDAAPVVRCKDCKNWDSSTEGRYVGGWCFCEKLQFSTSPDWFCADGEPEEMRPRSACGPDYCEIGGWTTADAESTKSHSGRFVQKRPTPEQMANTPWE